MSVATLTLSGRPVRHFTSCDITMQGSPYRIVGTEIIGRGSYDCVDTVRNEAGEYKEFKRLELLNLIDKL